MIHPQLSETFHIPQCPKGPVMLAMSITATLSTNTWIVQVLCRSHGCILNSHLSHDKFQNLQTNICNSVISAETGLLWSQATKTEKSNSTISIDLGMMSSQTIHPSNTGSGINTSLIRPSKADSLSMQKVRLKAKQLNWISAMTFTRIRKKLIRKKILPDIEIWHY